MNQPMKPGLALRLQQRQKLAQQVQLSISLLPLNGQQLQRYLQLRLQDNPALGWRSGNLPAATAGIDSAAVHDIALATHAATPSLSEHLLQQLYLHDCADELKLLAEIIIDALDEDGYLPLALADLRAAHMALPDLPSTPTALWQQALQLVQSLDPAGIAAADLADCLRLQLLQEPASSQRELALQLINDDLQELATAESTQLAARHGCEVAAIKQAVQMIRSLEPKPGRPFAAVADVVQADAEILQQAGQLQVRLLQPASEAIELRNSARASAAQRQAARQLLQALQLREQNLHNIISAAAEQQVDMLMTQDQTRAKPLSQTELAAQLGLHPSTISRAVRTRHVLWRGKLLPLSSLFSHSLTTADGNSVASMAIKATLQQIVAAEPANKPYSDTKLQQMLARQGYTIARRTVAKYRQLLGLAASHQRRQTQGTSE